MEIFFGVILTVIGFFAVCYGIWNLDKNKGFPIILASLIPLTIGLGILEYKQNESFHKECLSKGGVIAYTQSEDKICIPKDIKGQ